MAKFTVSELLMRRVEFNDLSLELQSNALTIVGRLNEFFAGYTAPIKISSGYRPSAINSAAGGATASKHLICAAADLADANGDVWQYCLDNLEYAQKLKLWFEDKRWTPTWVHLQIQPPRSGKRIYIPNAKPALAPNAWTGVYDKKFDSKA